MGWFAQTAVLPAFANAEANSELVAIVSDDHEKRDELGEKYGVPAVPYSQYDTLLAAGGVDAVYIVLPSSMHADYTIRAAAAGVRVLCEKPMAPTVREGEQMIAACTAANVRLMIAYRLHFEEANLGAAHIVNSGKIGEPRLFNSVFTQQVNDTNNIRLDGHLGGGPLEDIGIYCLNASRYLFRDEPTEVSAFAETSLDPRFTEVDEMVSVQMRFPNNRIGQFVCGFGAEKVSTYTVAGALGNLRLDPAYSFDEPLKQYLTIDGTTTETKFAQRDQISPEILYFSECLQKDRQPEPSGLEGLLDIRVIEAIRESCQTGRSVKLTPVGEKRRPGISQAAERPAVKKEKLVKATPPSGRSKK